MKTLIRILIVESHPLNRLGLKSIINEQADMKIVGEAMSGAEGLELHRQLEPDVTLFELRMPDLCGVDAVKELSDISRDSKIIILAAQTGDVEINRALKNGACGYVLKDAPPDELLKAIRAVSQGKRYVSPKIAEVLTENFGAEDLTPAEMRVLKLIVEGISNKEIAANLEISENTVKTHLKNIFGKLGVDDRTAAAMSAIKRGVIRFDG